MRAAAARSEFTTPKGTALPLLNLRGKEYLQVQHRIVWFREDHPDWRIQTELREIGENYAIAKAVIVNEKGEAMASAHKCEDKAGFNDYIEKAETGAIGRALALVGYGTQFTADEFEEGARVVDTPSAPKPVARPAIKPVIQPNSTESPGEFRIPFGPASFKGKALKEIDPAALARWTAEIEHEAKSKNKEIKGIVAAFLQNAYAWLKQFDDEVPF